MNADTNDFETRGSPNEGERLHQLLCATVLGEATDAERAEVERELANSPELRAERARLEATIGLVTSSLSDGERLSPAAEQALADALARRRAPLANVRRWYATPAFRVAASVLAIGGLGFLTLRSFDDARRAASGDELVARTELPASEARRKSLDDDGRNANGELQALGYLGAAESAPSAPAEPKNEPAATEVARAALARAVERGEASEEKQGHSGEGLSQFASRVVTPATTAPAPAESAELSAENLAFDVTTSFSAGLEKRRDELTSREQDRFIGTIDSGTVNDAKVGRVVLETPNSKREGPTLAGAITSGAVATGGGGGGPASPGPSGSATTAKRGLGTYRGPSDGVPPGEGKKDKAVDRLEESEQLRLRSLGYVETGDTDESRAAGEAGRAQRGGQVAFDNGGFRLVPDAATVEARVRALLDGCRRMPNERPRDMYFRFWGDNGYEYPTIDRLSTFSVDVDTASYALARNYLVQGYLPEKHAVRTEEFLNYFKGDVRPPEKGTFAIETEIAPSLFGESGDALMLRVAIRGKEITKAERTPVALTFVIDVSGSMREGDRLELVKNTLRLLTTQLDARDTVAIVTFSNDAQLVLPTTSAMNRLVIEQALQPLTPQASTNTEAGLRLGYEQAFAHLDPNAQNRVVLLTDGVANVGITDPNAMIERVATQRKAGIYLNTIGVGMQNHNDTLLEQLADRGDGLCNYVDDAAEAKRALVDNFTGAFQPIARDVKVQVEFDPAQVARYRLLGYENRAIADRDFRNDAVDAGEVGAGHQVIALYELVPTHGVGDGPLATVRLRWKDPRGEGASDAAHESAHPVTSKSVAGSYEQTSPGYRRAILVAQFAEFLRRSVHANGDSLDRLIEASHKLGRELRDPEFDEFTALVAKSRDLILAQIAQRDPCDDKLDALRRIECLRAEVELLRRDGELAQLDTRRAALETELSDCLRRRMTLEQR